MFFTLTPPFPEFTDDGNLRERHERDYILYIHSVVYVNVSSIYSEIYTFFFQAELTVITLMKFKNVTLTV